MATSWVRKVIGIASLCMVLLCTSCLGPGHATGHLFKFNKSFENKWAQEGMFLVMIPGYILFSFADKIIFNSIQWWTGTNPISVPGGEPDPVDFGL
jgi:hypothetical protein